LLAPQVKVGMRARALRRARMANLLWRTGIWQNDVVSIGKSHEEMCKIGTLTELVNKVTFTEGFGSSCLHAKLQTSSFKIVGDIKDGEQNDVCLLVRHIKGSLSFEARGVIFCLKIA